VNIVSSQTGQEAGGPSHGDAVVAESVFTELEPIEDILKRQTAFDKVVGWQQTENRTAT